MSSFRITPIGTCRIHTPLSRAVGRYPIELDLRRNYGFVHTSEEVLQQLRFLQGEQQFRPEILPLLIRGGFEKLGAESWQPADLHIVEISSAKRFTCGGEVVQANYVYRHFADFFANNERARRFWKRVRKGHRQDLSDFLERQPTYQLLSPADRELLANLSIEQQTFRAVKSDMAEIVERLGRDRLLFVTHVNAAAPGGAVIPARARLIRWVTLAAEQLDAPLFNPTKLMAEFGQELALEERGLDLTHYTPAFSDRLYDVIHQDYVAPLLGSRAEAAWDEPARQVAALTAKVESMMDRGDFFAGARELHAAIERFPDSIPLLHMRGLVRSRIGDFRGAAADLSADGDGRTASPQMRFALLEALTEIGDDRGALKVAQDLIDSEAESIAIYRMASDAAERVGDYDLAIRYAKQAYRLDRSDLTPALRALELLSTGMNEVDISEWRSEILDNIGTSSSGMFEICDWAVRQSEEALFAGTLPAVAAVDKTGSLDLMEEALETGNIKLIAATFPVAIQLGRLSRELAERRAAILQRALQLAHDLADQGAVAQAHELASAIASLAGTSSTQVPVAKFAREAGRLLRQLALTMRDAVREAFAAGDTAAVIELSARSGEILQNDTRSALLLARSLHESGDTEAALDLLRSVQPDGRDQFLVRRWTARLALAANDYTTALETYGALRESNDPQLSQIQVELDRFFAKAEGRSTKELSLLARAGEHEEALRLARAINRFLGPLERAERELGKMHKALRLRLKEIEEGKRDSGEREAILKRMLAIKPDDGSTLRRLAMELMRQFRYAEAAEYWGRLLRLDPSNLSADRNRVRCVTLAHRRASDLAQVTDVAG